MYRYVLIAGIIYSVIMASNLVICFREERAVTPGDSPRYNSFFTTYSYTGLLLGIYFLISLVKAGSPSRFLATALFPFCLQITVFYLLLLLLRPLLRTHFQPLTCAMLWFLPCLLLVLNTTTVFYFPVPRYALHIDSRLMLPLLTLWLTGFLAVLLWYVAGHIRFTRSILRSEQPVTDPVTLEVWSQELKAANLSESPCQLVRSSRVHTPLAFGFRKNSLRLVLPEKTYTPEDLALIFRHELIHLGRRDNIVKVMLTIFTALCWFNPLMWLAMRWSADDLELSCDQSVLRNADSQTRRHYAELLLNTAGEQRGFTTCMSAAAQTFRYRLKHVLTPEKRRDGAVLIGCFALLIVLSCAQPFALSFRSGTGQELIFNGEAPEPYQLSIQYAEDKTDHNYFASLPSEIGQTTCTDPAKLTTYLSELELDEISLFNSRTSNAKRSISLTLTDSQGETTHLSIHDSLLTQITPSETCYYYLLKEPVDWAFLSSLLIPKNI